MSNSEKTNNQKTHEMRIKEMRRDAMLEQQLRGLTKKVESMESTVADMQVSLKALGEAYEAQLIDASHRGLRQPVSGSQLTGSTTEGGSIQFDTASSPSAPGVELSPDGANRVEAVINAAFAELFKPQVKYTVGFEGEVQTNGGEKK